MRDVRGVETSVSAAVARLRWRGRYAPRCRSGGASGGGRDENIALGSCLRCEAADDVRRDVYLHGRRHMRSRISLRGCPAYSVVVRWESMERGDTTFGVRLVVYDRAASCAKWHVERQRKGGARGPPSGVLVC